MKRPDQCKLQSAKCKVQSDDACSAFRALHPGFILHPASCILHSAFLSPLLLALFLAIPGLPTRASGLAFNRDSLPNGLIIITCETSRLPMADVALVCRSGAECDPAGKAGLASLVAGMLPRGTKTMSADSVASIIDFLGAGLDASADFDQAHVILRVLSRDLEAGLSLLAGAVLEPGFDAREFENARTEALTHARRIPDSPMSLVRTEFYRLLFPNHPYGNVASGDTVSLAGIKREDAIAFHKTHYVPNNCFIVAVGDIRRADFLELVKKQFGAWQPGPVPPVVMPEVTVPPKLRVRVISRPEMTQTYIQFGHPGISKSDPDRLALRVADYVLGGSALGSRLGDAVREKAGLAYDVASSFDEFKYPGAFSATVQTVKPKEALRLMFDEIQRLQQDGVTAREMSIAQSYFTGSFPLRLASNQGKLMSVGDVELYGLGKDWLDTYPDNIRALTLDEVNRAAQTHLRPGHYVMVVVGNVTKEDLGLSDVEWIE